MKAARRVVLEVVGWLLLLAGVAALVLPGPGLLMIFAGLAVLSQQYEWAERRLAPVKYRALKGAAESVGSWPRIAVSALATLLLLVAGVVWISDPDVPAWWFADERWWLPGGLATGVTQVASAAIAAGLLVYSYRRFHGRPEAVALLEREIAEADAER